MSARPRPLGGPRASVHRRRAGSRRADLLRVGTSGLRSRRPRTFLTAIGIGIGIAAMVAVLGISESSRAGLLAQLDQLGTNLLTVSPGQKLFGGSATLPLEAPAMIGRIGPVQATAADRAGQRDASTRPTRSRPSQTGGLCVWPPRPTCWTRSAASLADGVFLNAATAQLPGRRARRRRAPSTSASPASTPASRSTLGGHWFTVVGILEPVALAPELDRTALIGFPVAESMFGIDGSAAPSTCAPTQPRSTTSRRSSPARPTRSTPTRSR